MKKMISILLAAVMLLSCASALAEATTQAPIAVKTTTTFRADEAQVTALYPMIAGSAMDEQTAALVNAIVTIINNASAEITAQDNGGAVSVKLGDTEILNGVFTASEDKVYVDTSLMPTYTLDATAVAAELAKEFEAFGGSMDELAEKLPAMLEGYYTEFMTMAQECMGETAAKDTEIDGVTYNTVTPMQVTAGQAGTVALTVIDRLSKDEAALELLSKLDKENTLMGQLTQATEQLKQLAALKGTENDPVMINGTIYMTADQQKVASIYEISAGENQFIREYVRAAQDETGLMNLEIEVTMAAAYPENGDWTTITSSPNYIGSMNVSMDASDTTCVVNLTMDVQGITLGLSMQAVIDPENELNGQLTCGLYVMNMESPILVVDTVTSAQAAAELSVPQGKTVLAIEENMDEATQQTLVLDITSNGLSQLIQNAYAAMPDAMMVILTALTPAPTAEPEAVPAA